MKQINEGAEAKIYSDKVFGEEVIVKRRLQKRYRIPEIDQELRENRTRKEAKILHTLGKAGVNAPRLIGVGRFSVYMNRVLGKLLRDVGYSPVLFKNAGRELAMMHRNNVVHGDFTPANLMVVDGKVFVIDFGLSEMTHSIEDKAIDILLMKRSIPSSYYRDFIRSYAANNSEAKRILNRLNEIEKRGRYQIRTLT